MAKPARAKPVRGVTLYRVPGVAVEADGSVNSLPAKIAVVADALGSKAAAAAFLGVARSQPGKWISGEERPNKRAERLILDFDYVWSRVTAERSPEATRVWLSSASAYLNGATPLTWLKTRGPAEIILAFDAEESGSYA